MDADAETLQKLIDLAKAQDQTWIKVEFGVWHNAREGTDFHIHFVRDSGPVTGEGFTFEEAFQHLQRQLKTGED